MEENGENFDGKCYVFDNRIGIDVNTINPKNISSVIIVILWYDDKLYEYCL